MKTRSTSFITALALASSVALTGCGNSDQPLTQAQFERRMQEQQLQAQRDQANLQTQIARQQLEQQRIQTNALQQQYAPAPQPQIIQQPVYTTAPPVQQPVQQPVVVDQGIGTGTAIVGAAAAAGLGYMAGKATANTNKSTSTYDANRYDDRRTSYVAPSRPTTFTSQVQPSAPKVTTLNLSKPTTTVSRPITTVSKSTSLSSPKPTTFRRK